MLTLLTGKVKHFELNETKTKTTEFKNRDIKVRNDVYSLSFTALLHPDEVEKDEKHYPSISHI